ncbi:hypothetical protein [Chryseobacterium sp. CT-SW4]|uniref:hypothetical protein n=1 Tax=Chryseobacterium sp. SW-1 TaxID=3157343 RepID=UPI003B013566
MKNHIYFCVTFLLFFNGFNAQVSIGKTSVNGNSTLLDFYDNTDNTEGIIIPAVTSATVVETVGTPAPGTFILDQTDQKIKVYENSAWLELSDAGDTSALIVNNETEKGNGVILGDQSSTASGILVLEDPAKAMVLPKIENPHINVPNPYPGMICYDTVSQSLAVFDGENWSYWK